VLFVLVGNFVGGCERGTIYPFRAPPPSGVAWGAAYNIINSPPGGLTPGRGQSMDPALSIASP